MKKYHTAATSSFWYTIVIFATLSIVFTACKQQPKGTYRGFSGDGIGTYYQISVRDSLNRDLQPSVDSILKEMNLLFSLFSKESVITAFNQASHGVTDPDFATLTLAAKRLSLLTNGSFEPTIAPLVRLWGFGPDSPEQPDSTTVAALLANVGMKHIHVNGDSVLKDNPAISLDYNGIAKGYTVDKVANFLEEKGIRHYMVNIGGEIRAKGLSARAQAWIFGIETPEQNSALGSSILRRIQLSECALATSGNYRSFREEGGRQWGHTINPRTGYPEANSLLSATVVAPTCTEADALATSLMVMGLDSAKRLVERLPDIEALLISRYDSATYEIWTSTKMTQFLLPEDGK